MLKLNRYYSMGYTSIFNPNTGFFARVPDKGVDDPFWCPQGPELMDISITNWCDKECTICYKSSDSLGSHMALDDYKYIINQAAEMGTFQVALGGGNPNQHPDFIEIIKYTASKGIVPNYTTNGRGLSDEILKATKENCGVVAVSAYPPYHETATAIECLVRNGIKTNVHYILDAHSIHTAIDWLKDPPDFLSGINAIIFLNYKPLGRITSAAKLLRHSHRLDEFFRLSTSPHRKLKAGFDACCVSGIFSYTNAPSAMVDACDAGRFSLYVSEDLHAYPCSFQCGLTKGDQIKNDTKLLDIWTKSQNFIDFRRHFHSSHCGPCNHRASCMNGCPLFENIALCENYTTHST